MYSSSQLKWHERAWFGASVVLHVISLSSFLDDLLGMHSWISDVLAKYRILVDIAISHLGFPPRGMPTSVVAFLSQVLLFMGGLFAAANFYALRTEGQTVFQRIYETSFHGRSFGWIRAVLKTLYFYITGPALLVRACWRAIWRRAPFQREVGFTFRPVHVAAYYIGLVGLVTLSLVIASYFYNQFQISQAFLGLGVASWQVSRLLL